MLKLTTDLLKGLSSLYDLQPRSNLDSLISHSPADLSEKAWKMTGTQLQSAIRATGARISNEPRQQRNEWTL